MKNTIIIICGIIVSIILAVATFDNTGVHNTPNGTVFCKNKIKRVFHDQSFIITEDDIAFYGTKDGKYDHLVPLAKKECM